MDNLRTLELSKQKVKDHQMLDQTGFDQLELPVTILQTIKVSDFIQDLPQLKKLVAQNLTNNYLDGADALGGFGQKVDAYTAFNGMFSGLEFMGFFLGITFSTMLASCLMFKILSGRMAG